MTISGNKGHREDGDPHWIEWVTGTLSCVVVGAMIGWIAWQAMHATQEPPLLSTTVTEMRKVGEVYRVEFDIVNAAPTTAASVTVTGEIAGDGTVSEAADVTFDYVAARSKSHGALLFRKDPAAGEFHLRPSGYTDP